MSITSIRFARLFLDFTRWANVQPYGTADLAAGIVAAAIVLAVFQ